ncbi:hypothetical protein GW17_00018745 [Ensete ventricosum]|nr:hypothetical protein GW17_00018745 [Ensete ventricosum]RZR90741.1 hypothetical protein BHM03_00018707 [Ensete ventricosum]
MVFSRARKPTRTSQTSSTVVSTRYLYLAYDRSSAPKDCTVSAWFEEPGSDPSKHAEKTFILTKFSYDLEKSNAQTFKVETAISGIINIVRLDFSSNHGSSTLTCIYRFRVHGYKPNFTSKNTGIYRFRVHGYEPNFTSE